MKQVAASPSVANGKFLSSLFGVFGGLAILLALIGIYGVVAWVIGQRTLEVGIRVAIGARRGSGGGAALRRVLGGRFRCVADLAPGGVGLGRMLNSMFWKMTSPSPLSLPASLRSMFMVAVAVAVTPIRRVLRLDPQFLLRNE